MLTVLWSIGWSMILLGLIIKISIKIIFPIGLLLFALHDYFGGLLFSSHTGNNIFGILFMGLVILPIGKTHSVAFLYSILPWTCVMFLGYCFGKYVQNKRFVFRSGLFLVFIFLV